MTKAKKHDDEDAAGPPAEPRGVFDDLPYAEESPSVQKRAPSMGGARHGDEKGHGPGAQLHDAGAPERRSSDRRGGEAADAVDTGDTGDDVDGDDSEHDAPSEVSEDALAEAALLVRNDLIALERERDEYLDGLRRVQAEFENYRKRVIQQQSDQIERAAEALVTQLLPVLDACDAAVQHGADDVVPVQSQLVDTLVKQGLERIDPSGEAFDPNFHEAVMHEPADDDGEAGTAVVVEVLRTGYGWRGRVLRPAMVKVKG